MKSEFLSFKLLFIVATSLIFLALNSIWCRLALANDYIDAYSFTLIRLSTGALALYLILFFKKSNYKLDIKSNWSGGFFLFLYAFAFSFSFLKLDAGIGTLILFGSVQISMILVAFLKGEKLTLYKFIGLFIAFFGLSYLLIPKDDFEISLISSILMIIAGISWGFYTLNGKKSKDIFFTTTDNFVKSSIFTFILLIFFISTIDITINGFIYATISGVLTSAIGYVLWYIVVNKINIFTASIIQLSVPILSIFLATIMLNEKISSELIISSALILFGIFISNYRKKI